MNTPWTNCIVYERDHGEWAVTKIVLLLTKHDLPTPPAPKTHTVYSDIVEYFCGLCFQFEKRKTLNALQTSMPLFTGVNNHLFVYHCLSLFSLVALKHVMKTAACRNPTNSCTFITIIIITFCVGDWRKMLPQQSGWFTQWTRSCCDSYCESTHLFFKCVLVLFWLP